MIKINDALFLLERTDASGRHIPCSLEFGLFNKDKKVPGNLHIWKLAHATGHRHNKSKQTISILNVVTNEVRTVNHWLIFKINGTPISL